MTRPSFGRTSQGPSYRAHRNASSSPTLERGWSWRSVHAVHQHGYETRRRACLTEPAGSHHRRAASAFQRSCHSFPSRALRGQCRHRRPALLAALPRQGGDYSSACASVLLSASFSLSAHCRSPVGLRGYCRDGSFVQSWMLLLWAKARQACKMSERIAAIGAARTGSKAAGQLAGVG